MKPELIRCARALVDGETREDYAFVISDGIITAAGAYVDVVALHPDTYVRAFPKDRLIAPGFVNGHSHAYQVLMRGWADDWTFAKWRSDALYAVIPHLTPDDIYTIFTFAFSEMLAAGITTVAEFFYVNGAGNAHAHAAIEAAREVGIRLVFARTWMDAEYAPPAFRETIDVAAERTSELRARYPDVDICVAPHSLHAASLDMIRACAEYAGAYGCMLHVHVAEARYEGEQTIASFGATPIVLLDRLGALNERTVAIHAIYLTEDEKRLVASTGARVVHNPVTNQYLGDGICDVVGMQALGITMGLGSDADVKPSILDEMRAASYLQKVSRTDGSALGAKIAFDMGTAQGARALGVRTGALKTGYAADFLVLDASAIDPWSPETNALVYRGSDSWVQAAFVGGKRVYTGAPSNRALEARSSLQGILSRILS